MAFTIVRVASGGIPVVESATGFPYYEADNGFGIPVTFGSTGIPLGRAGGTTPVVPQTVGGDVVGAAGAGFYSGYTLAWGDDFDGALNIVGPSTPTGKYFTTKSYSQGPRGNQSSLGTAADVDPLFTGYQNSNRGVAVGFDNMVQTGSELILTARKATGAEQAHLPPTAAGINGGVRNEITSMIHTGGDCVFYPDTNEVIVEWRYKTSASNPASFHVTNWLASLEAFLISANIAGAGGVAGADEWDASENGSFNRNVWSATPATTSYGAVGDTFDGTTYRTLRLVIRNGGNVELYLDGVLKFQPTASGNSKSKALYALLTAHILNDGSYVQSDYNTAVPQRNYQWIKVWNRTAASRYSPQASIPNLNVDYAGSGSLVLQSAATLWGSAPTTEWVGGIPAEGYDPGMTESTTFAQLPAGVTYNTGTRTVAADFTAGTGNAGRIHMMAHANSNGSVCRPARFCINRGPHLAVASIPITIGTPVSFDLYAAADCGSILPKTISVTGLPSGLSYSSVTGLITGTPTAAGTGSVTITNGVGQTVTNSVDFWQPSALAGLVYHWDTNNTTATPDDGSGHVATLCDVYDNTKRIAQTTTGARPTISSSGGPSANKRVMTFVSPNILRSDDALATNASGITGFANTADVRTGDKYFLFAAKENTTSQVNRLIGWFDALGASFEVVRYTTTGRGHSIQGLSGSAQATDQAVQDANWHVFEVIKNGATVTFKVDGVAVAGPTTITQTGGITGTMFLMGANNSGGTVGNGFIGSMGPGLLANVMPSAAEQDLARRYIGGLMGIAVS